MTRSSAWTTPFHTCVPRTKLLRRRLRFERKLRPGGLFLASIRDYDALVRDKPVVQGPAFYADDGRRRIVHQVWDWLDDRRYIFHLYITRETSDGWESQHFVSTYRALLRSDLTNALEQAGFLGIRWLFPTESGFYQPIVLANTPVRYREPSAGKQSHR